MPTKKPTIQPRGWCPVCRREVTLLDDHTVARPHKDGHGSPCAGYGLEGQPIGPVIPERIRVRMHPHTKRWRVEVGTRLAYVCDGFDDAQDRAAQLAERQRERAVEAENLALHQERFGDGRKP